MENNHQEDLAYKVSVLILLLIVVVLNCVEYGLHLLAPAARDDGGITH